MGLVCRKIEESEEKERHAGMPATWENHPPGLRNGGADATPSAFFRIPRVPYTVHDAYLSAT
jgi:hypothetical protein